MIYFKGVASCRLGYESNLLRTEFHKRIGALRRIRTDTVLCLKEVPPASWAMRALSCDQGLTIWDQKTRTEGLVVAVDNVHGWLIGKHEC